MKGSVRAVPKKKRRPLPPPRNMGEEKEKRRVFADAAIARLLGPYDDRPLDPKKD